MPLGLQPKLLRALQDRRVRPVGGDGEIPFDARIVSATHRDIHSAVEERLFREDLFFRINVIHIELPPLRARGADALLLSQRFLETLPKAKGVRVSGFSRAAAKKIAAYPWPGNVRELMNCIERALAITRSTEIEVEDLPDRVREYEASHVLVASDDPSDLLPLEEVERRYIERVLEASGGNKSTAAKILRVDRKTLYRKLTRFGLSEKSDTDDGPT
jgi:two-component system response regulator HydG